MNCLHPGPRRHCHDEAEPRAPRGRARGVGLGPAVRFFRPHEPPATHASSTRDQPNFARPPPSRGGSLLRGGLPSPLHLSLPVTVFQGVSVGPGLIGLPSFSFRKCCTMRIPKAFFCLASRRVVSFVSNSSFFLFELCPLGLWRHTESSFCSHGASVGLANSNQKIFCPEPRASCRSRQERPLWAHGVVLPPSDPGVRRTGRSRPLRF